MRHDSSRGTPCLCYSPASSAACCRPTNRRKRGPRKPRRNPPKGTHPQPVTLVRRAWPPMTEAANTAAPLRAVASSVQDAASAPARGRKTNRRLPCCSRCRHRPNRHPSLHATTNRLPTNRPPRRARYRRRDEVAQPQARRSRTAETVRARHQRADARPEQPLPLRGTRRLSADDDARGTRQPQEGMSEVARNARSAARSTRSSPMPARSRPASRCRASAAARRSAACTSRRSWRTSRRRRLARRQGRQPDPRRRARCATGPIAAVLVSKDINMRIKAHALSLPAEDYFNDHARG